MKRIFAIILAAVSLIPCLSGCVRENIGVTLNRNGTGSVSVTVGIEKSFADQIAGEINPFEGKKTEETEYDGKTYITYTETKEYGSFEEIEKALSNMTFDPSDSEIIPDSENTDGDIPAENEGTYIFKTVKVKKDGSKYVFDAVLNKVSGQVRGFEVADNLKLDISVEMPAKVKAYKNGLVDGRKITFNITDLSRETELYAECKTASVAAVVICGVLAVASIAAFFVIRKKK